jgi:low temperature requirement protein LtrA
MRVRHGHDHARVTFVELFFDLVFVFAVTQLSHSLIEDMTPLGALHTLILLVAVWWVWVYTAWATNWLDPERVPVRLLLFAVMLVGLVMSASIPEAFAALGLPFAAAVVLIQVGRTSIAIRGLGDNRRLIRNFQRIVAWLVLSGAFWLAGGMFEGGARLALWLVAVAIDYGAPAAAFWTPGLGRSEVSDWNVEGGHMAERCGLFIIIALGESILVMGATFSGLDWTWMVLSAFLASFVASVTMWWIYFNATAAFGSRIISTSSDPGRLARLAYTYLHLPIVAGIIVTAVADELVLAHPGGHADPSTVAAILGGPALYLAGIALFKWSITSHVSLSHCAGIILLAIFAATSAALSPLALGMVSTIVLVVIAAWDTVQARRYDAKVAETARGGESIPSQSG